MSTRRYRAFVAAAIVAGVATAAGTAVYAEGAVIAPALPQDMTITSGTASSSGSSAEAKKGKDAGQTSQTESNGEKPTDNTTAQSGQTVLAPALPQGMSIKGGTASQSDILTVDPKAPDITNPNAEEKPAETAQKMEAAPAATEAAPTAPSPAATEAAPAATAPAPAATEAAPESAPSSGTPSAGAQLPAPTLPSPSMPGSSSTDFDFGTPKSERGTSVSGVDADPRMVEWNSKRPEEQKIHERLQKIEGKTIVDVVCEGASESTLATAKAALTERAGDKFSVDVMENDRSAIYSTGYFYDLYPSFEEVPEGVVVTFHLLENPILKSVDIAGNTVVKTETLRSLLTVKTGAIMNSAELQRNIRDMQQEYRKDGYILAKVSDLRMDMDGSLHIRINEGTLEGYKIKGNKKTKDYVILREMRQKVGEPFNATKARRSMQRVYNLGFFEDVNMKLNPGIEPNAVVLEIDIKEKSTGTFGVGAGYSSEDGIIGMLNLGDTNFRGTGDAVNIMYEMSGDDDDAHGYTFSYRHPYMDKHETTGTFRIYNRTYQYDDYDSDGDFIEEYMRKYKGGEITVARPVSEYSTNVITLRNRDDKYVKYEEDEGGIDRSGENYRWWREKNFGLTRSVTLAHITDNRDNIYFPTMGGRIELSTEIAGFGGDFDFQKYVIEDQRYFKVGHAQVIATRAQAGYGHGSISESNQFRIGGQDTIRGYREQQFRGNKMLLGTVEYRFPITGKVQGALFTDWGNAWEDKGAPDEVHGSFGAGLSLNTPLGPIRIDWGRGSQGSRVHFMVGNSF